MFTNIKKIYKLFFKPKLKVKRLESTAIIPTKGSEFAAGYDLYSLESVVIQPLHRFALRTGISVEIPTGLYGRIAPRSGLAANKGVDVLAGVIDSDFRGELKVILINLGQHPLSISKGDKIAQLVLESCTHLDIEELDTLNSTERGHNGFGSTGK